MSRIFDAFMAARQRGEAPEPSGDPFPVVSSVLSPHRFRPLDLHLSENSRVIFGREGPGSVVEQFRLLRRKLTVAFPHGGVLLVTSPVKGDGKTVTSANLAGFLAESEASTLLVETDLRNPSVAALLGCQISEGVEMAFTGEAAPEDVVRVVAGSSLHVAAMSQVADDPAAVLRNPGFARFVEWSRQHFQYVILDTPALLPVADVMEMLALADSVVLVVRARVTSKELVAKAFEVLGPRLKTVILNDASCYADGYYGYYYYQQSPKKK